MFNRLKLALLTVLLSLAAVGGRAQVSTATLNGVIQDSGGGLIPGATVMLTQTETNAKAHATTTDSGAFTLPSLPVGPYVLDVTAPGFSAYKRTNIVLTVGQVATLKIELAIGASTETITVTTGAPLIESTEPTLSDTIDEKTVVSLPLNGRNPGELVFTAPGVSNATENLGTGQLATTNQITPPGVTIPNSIATAVNGVRAGGTFFSLDGAVNVDPDAVIGGPFPDPDATQEFQVVTGTYGARYFSAPGGAVNIITHSGTNKLHGTVFEFIRNGYVNAENAALAQPDNLKRNQFGGTIGGPIRKDKLFFFASYQGTRIASQTPSKVAVPTAQERAGIFQACPVDKTCDATNTFNVPLAALPPIAGPNTLNAVNANFFNYKSSGSPLIPLPNSAGNFLITAIPNHVNSQQFAGKLDYQVNQKHRLFMRYFSDRYNTPAVEEATTAPFNIFRTAAGLTQNFDSAAIGDTWTPTSKLVLDTRVSYLNIVSNQTPPASASFVNYPNLGAANYSNPTPPGIGITVIGSTVTPAVYGTTKAPRTNFTVSEDVIYAKGNHEFTFGGDIQRIHNGTQNPAGQTGVIIYAGVYSAIIAANAPYINPTLAPKGLQLIDASFADFYLGRPVVFIQGDGFFSSHHGSLAGFYVQDKYKASDRLTLTAGIRYDPFLPYKTENNQVSCFRAGQQSTVFANAPKGLIYPGDPNCPTGGVGGQYNFVQPRVGVAYQLNEKGTQSVRAGYGVYQIQLPLNALTGFQAAPFTRQLKFSNPFQSISDIYGSNKATNPFASGYIGFGYQPAANIAFPTVPANAANFSSNFRPGYIQQYSLSYSLSLGSHDGLEIAYVGTKGTHLAQNYDANEPGAATAATGAASTSNEQARRPNTGIAVLSTAAPIGYSNYSGLQASFHHQATGGFDYKGSFTYSKCIDNGSNPGSTGSSVAGNIDLDPNNQAFSRGVCDFDQPINFRNTLVYATPRLLKSSPLVRTALGGWSVSGNFIFDSGQPFSVTANSADQSFTGTSLDRADLVPGQPTYVNGRLNFNAFRLNAAGTLGNSPRNGYRAQNNIRIDTALLKTFALTERFGLDFRAEAFNVINHANYFAPLTAIDGSNSSNFDSYQFARDPRQLQAAVKLTF